MLNLFRQPYGIIIYMGTAVDTLKIYERLKSANMDDKAAKEVAEVINDVVEEDLVTKQYLDLRLAELKHDLTVRMGKLLAWQTGVFIAAVAALIKIIK